MCIMGNNNEGVEYYSYICLSKAESLPSTYLFVEAQSDSELTLGPQSESEREPLKFCKLHSFVQYT